MFILNKDGNKKPQKLWNWKAIIICFQMTRMFLPWECFSLSEIKYAFFHPEKHRSPGCRGAHRVKCWGAGETQKPRLPESLPGGLPGSWLAIQASRQKARWVSLRNLPSVLQNVITCNAFLQISMKRSFLVDGFSVSKFLTSFNMNIYLLCRGVVGLFVHHSENRGPDPHCYTSALLY